MILTTRTKKHLYLFCEISLECKKYYNTTVHRWNKFWKEQNQTFKEKILENYMYDIHKRNGVT